MASTVDCLGARAVRVHHHPTRGPICLITDGGVPPTVFLLSRAVLRAAATGSACRRFPSSQTLPRQATPFHPERGGWLASLRLPPHASPTRRTDLTPLGAVPDPRIVIKKHRSSLSRNTVHLTHASAALLHHFFMYRARGYRATLIGSAAGMRRNTCANQRPLLRLRSSAF
jgi:hypothetical protein